MDNGIVRKSDVTMKNPKIMYNNSLVDQLKVSSSQSFVELKQNTSTNFGLSEKKMRAIVKKQHKEIGKYQERLYAEGKQSLLVVFQAMDAAGKDSAIRELNKRCNAQGVRVAKFGKPSDEELSHDYLWRVHKQTPATREFVIFNRSHYEDVLIVKVHEWVSASTIEKRYAQINQFESLLASSGTCVIKLMLNISADYQLSRFKSRLENVEKHWKFNPNDLKERKLWNQYMAAYEIALDNCSTDIAPWFVVPAENRLARDYAINCIILDAFQSMSPAYPEADFDAQKYTADTIR